MAWTPEQDQQLDALLAEGLTAQKIADRMGLTRNMVIGRAYRRHGRDAFKNTRPPTRSNSRRNVRERAYRARVRAGVPPKAYHQRIALDREMHRRLTGDPPPAAELPPPAGLAVANGHRCTILELTADRCHWPTWGDAPEEPRLYCGNPTEPDQVYCPGHVRLAFA